MKGGSLLGATYRASLPEAPHAARCDAPTPRGLPPGAVRDRCAHHADPIRTL